MSLLKQLYALIQDKNIFTYFKYFLHNFQALLMISSAWGLSCVMWVIPIYAWQYIEGERKVGVNIFNGP